MYKLTTNLKPILPHQWLESAAFFLKLPFDWWNDLQKDLSYNIFWGSKEFEKAMKDICKECNLHYETNGPYVTFHQNPFQYKPIYYFFKEVGVKSNLDSKSKLIAFLTKRIKDVQEERTYYLERFDDFQGL